VALARQFMRQPTQIRADHSSSDPAAIEHVEQFAYRAHALDKTELLTRVLQSRGRGLTLIFTRTKRTAAKLAEELAERGFAAVAIHGDLGQGAREHALRGFRAGKADVLVATDVAARGLDVEGITHVINYQAPDDEKTYIHRIGRTARAGASGKAITLVDWDEVPRWKLICDALGLPFHEPAETYSTSEHLFLELDIPEDAGPRPPGADEPRRERAARRARPEPSGPEQPRRQRTRVRTRGGRPVGPAAQESAPETPAPRRRRRRGGAPGPQADT
jgi:superfamily II DNA/RNA helicase